jgi:hypothetical protein
MIITLLSNNKYVVTDLVGLISNAYISVGGGSISLGGVLDRIRITTTNGTDTFDAGSLNIMYEG